ncbi:MAG TPA: mannitol dehydrogenase family protein [Acidothermaceae bacterium]|nr:mannitol dehydrogenase family protein [Acidothermaceae bacterium]
MARLSLATLHLVTPAARPPIDPRAVTTGIVHLGIGAFHRAHQGAFTQAAMAANGDLTWGICGVTQRSASVVEQLAPQDGLYSVLQRGEEVSVGVLATAREVLFAKTQAAELVGRIAMPSTRIVSMTVSEKGYRHDSSTGRLRADDPEVKGDAAGAPPRTVIGQLVRGMQARQRADGGPLTVVCCDNLHDNGRTVRQLVADFCDLLPASESTPLRDWAERSVKFPNTMVDRIVPATTDVDRAEAARLLGVDDFGVVVAEPFMQWVIEDDFAGPRPAWDAAGAIFTDDVAPYEAMKLRLLNGSHSAIAYLGALAGYEHVAEFIRADDVASYVRGLMDVDVTPTLDVPPGFDLPRYKDELLDRFANRGLRYRTLQIAMDGSHKLPYRLLGTIVDRLAVGAAPRHALLAVAAWMRFVSSDVDEVGRPITIDDPLAETLARHVREARGANEVVDSLLGVEEVFGPELRDDAAVRTTLVDYVDALAAKGVLGTLRELTR